MNSSGMEQAKNFDPSYIIPCRAHSSQIRSISLVNTMFTQSSGALLIALLWAMPSVKKLVISQIRPPHRRDRRRYQSFLGMIQSSQSNSSQQPGFPSHLETFWIYGAPAFSFVTCESLNHYFTRSIIIIPIMRYKVLSNQLHSTLMQFIYLTDNAIAFFLGLVERGVKVNIWVKSQNILQSSIDYYRKSSGIFGL